MIPASAMQDMFDRGLAHAKLLSEFDFCENASETPDFDDLLSRKDALMVSLPASHWPLFCHTGSAFINHVVDIIEARPGKNMTGTKAGTYVAVMAGLNVICQRFAARHNQSQAVCWHLFSFKSDDAVSVTLETIPEKAWVSIPWQGWVISRNSCEFCQEVFQIFRVIMQWHQRVLRWLTLLASLPLKRRGAFSILPQGVY